MSRPTVSTYHACAGVSPSVSCAPAGGIVHRIQTEFDTRAACQQPSPWRLCCSPSSPECWRTSYAGAVGNAGWLVSSSVLRHSPELGAACADRIAEWIPDRQARQLQLSLNSGPLSQTSVSMMPNMSQVPVLQEGSLQVALEAWRARRQRPRSMSAGRS